MEIGAALTQHLSLAPLCHLLKALQPSSSSFKSTKYWYGTRNWRRNSCKKGVLSTRGCLADINHETSWLGFMHTTVCVILNVNQPDASCAVVPALSSLLCGHWLMIWWHPHHHSLRGSFAGNGHVLTPPHSLINSLVSFCPPVQGWLMPIWKRI